MQRKHPLSKRGMSLIEVLLALVFLVFGLAGVMELYLVQSAHTARGQRMARASGIAYTYLAHLQASGYASLDQNIQLNAPLQAGSEADLFPHPTRSNLDPDFRWNAHLRKENRAGIPCIRIVVSTYWEPSDGPGGVVGTDRKKEVVGYVAAP